MERNDIAEASRLADQVTSQNAEDQRALHLRILTSYLSGQFEQALTDYRKLASDYPRRNDESLHGTILNAYLHLERYSDAVVFAQAMGLPEIERLWLEERVKKPQLVQLDGTTIVSFSADNFLGTLMPAVEVELNGMPLVAHIDTGGSFITMAPARAEELGIETRQAGTGVANNQSTALRRGLVNTLVLGDAKLTNVPVTTVESLTGQLESLVILGTRILSNFLMTWDNDRERLILTDRRNETARQRHRADYLGDVESTNFYLHADHYIWVNGMVGQHEVLMFLDTGLVTLDPDGEQPAGGIPASMLDVLNLDSSEGFTGSVSVNLGPVRRDVSSFVVFSDRRNLPRLGNIGPDVLLSHGFLKHYVWTLDFDAYRLHLRPMSP